jgi:peptidyl-prolyl cis-trans isomerase A (cyclophilin A)/peptidyl-prolyl cis-trans isomerase B (cyclophilin B)
MSLARPFAAAAAAALWFSASALAGPMVEMRTSLGSFTIELWPDKAPKTVDNFLQYVKDGHYKGLTFHRVIPGFVIQGGGLTPEMQPRPARAAIANEADNGLKNRAYTLSMARTRDPNSATSQFFVNLRENPALDHTAPTTSGWGYAVFGKVVRGTEVVDAIAAVPTGSVGPYSDVPSKAVVIEDARVLAP